ncbi:MAG: polysaccharide deacetylase family protein [Acidimicrobiia bacterium]
MAAAVLLATSAGAACATGDDGEAGGGGGRSTTTTTVAATSTTTTTTSSTTTTTTTTTTTAPVLPRGPIEVVRGRDDRPLVALTFDCGSSSGPTPAILDALRDAGVRVTFFLTGRWAEQNPELARRIAAEHELANHTYSHGDLSGLSDAQVLDELRHAEEVVRAVTGRGTMPLWRAPFGARSPRLLALAAEAGWPVHVFWSLDPLDWRDTPPEQVRANVSTRLTNGSLVLHHCGSPQTAEILADELRDVAGSGRRVVTVSELLAP